MTERKSPRYVDSFPGGHSPSCVEEAQVHWSSPLVQTTVKYCDHNDEHDNDHHHKKSLLEKVKHKAKKWRQALTKKKHNHDEDCSTPTSTCCAGSAGLEVDADDGEADRAGLEVDADDGEADRRHSAPTNANKVRHQSVAPAKKPRVLDIRNADKKPVLDHVDSFKESSSLHSSTAPATADRVVREFRAKQGVTINSNQPGNNKTIAEMVTEMLAPAYNMIASKIRSSPTARDEMGAKMMWDKSVPRSVSVKEYLRNKLEPGEEDKALSEVITEAMSPRKAGPRQQGEDVSMVEKVRRAVSSMLGKEELMGTQSTRVTSRPQQGLKPLRAPAISEQKSSPVPLSSYLGGGSPPIPVSTNPFADFEELGERRLQACAN